MYSSTIEFLDCYIDRKLNEFNTALFDQYIDCNFHCKYYHDDSIDIHYVSDCFCFPPTNENSLEWICECEHNVNYYDDLFLRNKILMFPKNKYFQKYYENVFLERIYLNKTFYFLPNGCKRITIKYIDPTIIDSYDISRIITYYQINNSIILIEDQMSGWFGLMFKHYHSPNSEQFPHYLKVLDCSTIHINDISIIHYLD